MPAMQSMLCLAPSFADLQDDEEEQVVFQGREISVVGFAKGLSAISKSSDDTRQDAWQHIRSFHC